MAKVIQLRSLFAFVCIMIIGTAFATPLEMPTQPALPVSVGSNPRPLKTCVGMTGWITDRIEPKDCRDALDLFRRAEGNKRGSQLFDFYAPGAKPKSTYLTLATPRKYAARTCTVTVAMVAGIPQGYRPPGVQFQHWQPNDLATLDGLRQAARAVVEDCVQRMEHKALAGWQPMGILAKSIGVFVWKTESFMDRLVQVSNGLAISSVVNETLTV
ncbi:MAG: hypothetical protein L6R39_001051 [Caloplaca ligustica]|nr:MAG: hypothetical protein L6R39_001051 [Caloplaca ligustica]